MDEDLDKIRTIISELSVYDDRLSLYTNILKMTTILESLSTSWKNIFSYANVKDLTMDDMKPMLEVMQKVGMVFVDNSDKFATIMEERAKPKNKGTNLAT